MPLHYPANSAICIAALGVVVGDGDAGSIDEVIAYHTSWKGMGGAVEVCAFIVFDVISIP